MILNFDRGHGQNSEQMVQSLMESTQLAFDTLERKLGLSGGSLIDEDGNVVTVTKLVNKSTDKIEANYLAVKGELYASEARIVDLEAANVTINDTLKAHDANIDNLKTNKADISTLNAEKARIDALEAGKADISSLTAESARIDNLEANKADISTLNAEIARIDTLEAGKADIDLANVNNAWITNGVIKDASIANEKVISVSANKLTAGTIDASKITVTNLNADNITVGTINGARIGNSSIDLDKLSQEVPTKEYLDSVEKKLQEEIDGAIETFTVSEIPTLNNEPAVNWTTDDIKSAHVGDLCYVVNSSSDNDGFCYRFQYNGTAYSWALIKDNDVTKAIQDIAELGGEVTQFKTDYTSKVSEIDGGIESLKSRTTAIETSVSTKVETSVFNTLKNTVDENSANITSLAETVTTKADSSTVTTLSNTVNEVKQTADANTSSISSLTTTVNSKADGSTVTELETKASTIEQNLNGVTTKVANLESTSEGFDTRLTAAESKITDDAIVSTVTSSTVYKDALSGKVDTSAYNTKMEQLDNSISLKATATEVYTKTQADAAFDAKGSASNAKSEAISSAKSYTDTATTDMATKEYVTSQGYLTVTSDAITSKVSKNEVISAINQTAESVSIDASKITLNGAVTFTSFDSSLQTTINNKAETSDLEAVRTTASNAQTSIDNLEIGGRNLFIDCKKTAGYLAVGNAYGILGPQSSINNEWTSSDIECEGGDSFVLQVWRTVPESITSQPHWRAYQCYANDNSLVGNRQSWNDGAAIDSNGVAYSVDIITIPEGASKFRFSARFYSDGFAKIEKGNKATDWTPAPEDVDTGIANVQTSIDNLEIGGRNLLPFETWSEQVGSVYEKENGTFSITSFGNYYHKPYVFGEVGETYTISVDAVTQDSTNPRVIVGMYDGSTFENRQYIRLGETPTNWETLATRNDINAVRLDYSSFSAPFIVKNLKIEKGSKATDWTPAPEDVDTGIANAAKTATSYITDINENSGIKVGAKNNANNYVQVNSNGMSVYQDINNSAVRVASLGANGVVLGIDKNAQTIVTADGIKIANASGIVGVSVDSSGTSQVATKVVNVYASIRQGSSYTLTLDSSIASGTSLEFKVELDGYSEFGKWFTITVGTNKSGTFSDSVQFSYTYNATNKQITITANSNDSVVLCFYRYDVASDLPLVQLNGVLEFNGNQQKDIKIEVDTSGNWTYEKWSSGIVKMYYTGTYSSTFNNGNYFGAYRGTGQTLTYPFTLASVIYANVDHIAPNTGFCLLSTYDTTQLKFYPYNRTNLTATQTDIRVIAEVVGRWK